MKGTEINFDDFNIGRAKTFVFIPADGKDMRTEYPELRSIDAFASLSNNELIFVWLVGNRTSPLYLGDSKNRKDSIRKALDWSKLTEHFQPAVLSEFINEQFPTKIQSAINKMTSFNPSVRMKAKMMTEKMLGNLSKMVDVSEEELSDMTLQEKSSYAGLVKTITNSLDELIVANEDAYGVKLIKRKESALKNQDKTLMDSIMDS